jgi:hypothetical protein
LASAELAYNEVDHTLYYGEGTGGAGGSATVVVAIAGQGLSSSALPLMDSSGADAGTASTWSRGDHVHPTDTSRAPILSPAFTGTPIAPTVIPGTDNTTKLATTAFVQSAVAAVSAGVTNITVGQGLTGGGTGNVTIAVANGGIANTMLATMPANTLKGNNTGVGAAPLDLTVAQTMTLLGAAPLASPGFIGVPTAPTPTNGTNTIQLATTAFVLATGLNQLQPPTGTVSFNNQQLIGLTDPTTAQGAATKGYVDGLVQGINTKASVLAATAVGQNIVLSGTQTIDGAAVNVGDRVLVKNQTNAAQNGIYVVATGAWTRGPQTDTWAELVSAYTFVVEGTTNASTGWLCTVTPGGTLETTPVTWTQFSGAGQVTAGNGLTQTGNTISAVGTANRIASTPAGIDIATNYAGQNSINTLGTVVTGTWNGSAVGVPYGGTGASALTGYLLGNGTNPVTASPNIPNTAITGLGTMSTQNANAVAITGGTIDGCTIDGGIF